MSRIDREARRFLQEFAGLPPIDRPETFLGVETATRLEAQGFVDYAALAYAGTAKLIHDQLVPRDPTAHVEELVCHYGVLRCLTQMDRAPAPAKPPERRTQIAQTRTSINQILDGVVLPNDDLRVVLANSADRLSSPLIQDAFKGRSLAELRGVNMQFVITPDTRFRV